MQSFLKFLEARILIKILTNEISIKICVQDQENIFILNKILLILTWDLKYSNTIKNERKTLINIFFDIALFDIHFPNHSLILILMKIIPRI